MEKSSISSEEKNINFESKFHRAKTFNKTKINDLDNELSEGYNDLKKYEFVNKNNKLQNNNLKFGLNKKDDGHHINNNCKFDETNSITTKASCEEKNIKKVTFSTVEIIKVRKFKKYNAINTYSKSFIEKNMKNIEAEKDNGIFCLMF